MKNIETFYLSFENGISRMSRGQCLKTAIEDALNAANTTETKVTILNNNLNTVGYIRRTTNPNGPLLPSVFSFVAVS